LIQGSSRERGKRKGDIPGEIERDFGSEDFEILCNSYDITYSSDGDCHVAYGSSQ
jgi:hypothetical protein